MNNGKEGLTSFIIGLIFLIVNCGVLVLAMSGFPFVFGGIFIIFPIAGIAGAIKAFKLDGAQRILGIIGLILNVFSGLEAIILIILGVIAKLN